MKILSKKHSSETIKKLNLNRVPEIVLFDFDELAIKNFCNKFKEDIYILRDVENPSGQYFLCKNVDECLNSARKYEGKFSLAVSCFAYSEIILLGEAKLTKSDITIVAGNEKGIHHRNVYEKAIINKTATLEDKELWKVAGVEILIEYLVKHSIYDVIVEFVVYDKNVGVNNEQILITELRNEY